MFGEDKNISRAILDLEVTPDNFSKLQDLKFNRKVSFELPSYTLVDISLVYYVYTCICFQEEEKSVREEEK